MALVNIAFCYSQLGDKDKTKEYYERTLRSRLKRDEERTRLEG